MPVIKDPIHNDKQGRYGVVYVKNLPGGAGEGLAVYDKSADKSNYVRHLPTGWWVRGPVRLLKDLELPNFIWCGIEIKYIIEIENYNAPPAGSGGRHGPVTDPDERFLEVLPVWDRPLEDPVNGKIYPLD
jgi:hypothetical protein